MRKQIKPTLLIVVAFILLSLLVNFIINYSNFFGENNLSFYNFDEDYKNDISVYNSDDSNMTFDYPSNWTYDIIEDGDKTVETLSLNLDNNVKIAYSELSDEYKEKDITEIVSESYINMSESFKNDGYTPLDDGIRYMDSLKIYYAKYTKGNNFYNRYSWKTKDGYLCEMFVTFEKSKLDQFNIMFDTLRFTDPESLSTFDSKFTNFSFNYPHTYSSLQTTFDDSTNTISQTLIKNINTSITINISLLDATSEKEFFDTIVKEKNVNWKKALGEVGFKCFSTGVIDIDNVELAYSYYRNGDKFTYIYYWYEVVNGKPTGGNMVFRFTGEDAKDFNTVLRTATFD